jgi:hypothetical protein
MKYKFLECHDCGGLGGWVEPVDYYIGGPYFSCQTCDTTGYITLPTWIAFKLRNLMPSLIDKYLDWRYNR